MKRAIVLALSFVAAVAMAFAADAAEPAVEAETPEAAIETIVVPAGTSVPLVMVNSVSTRNSRAGDPVYLQSIYPVLIGTDTVIPTGSHVSGKVIHSKRPGRVKGRGQLGVRFEQLILPNGVVRSLIGTPSAIDGLASESLDRETGTVKSEGSKGEDAVDVASATVQGVIVGGMIGRSAKGAGIGALGGAAAGANSVLLTRGPDATLARGSNVEMRLEIDLEFAPSELEFDARARTAPVRVGGGPQTERNRREREDMRIPRGRVPGVGGRLPRIGRVPL